MTELDDVVALVAQDVADGLGDAFEPTTGFSVLKDLPPSSPGGPVTYVPWSYRGRHVGRFHGLDGSQREVEIVGVTAVLGAGTATPTFARFIDWANVLAQLGVAIAARPVAPS